MTGRELIRFVDGLSEAEAKQLQRVLGWRLSDRQEEADIFHHVTGRRLLTVGRGERKGRSQRAQGRVTTMAALAERVESEGTVN